VQEPRLMSEEVEKEAVDSEGEEGADDKSEGDSE
jgi:hypothetical protein